ncbi:GLPGLI family protein [Cloacibacterium sp.]|jgi:GLPGLI family protein|uniref:GLPGLI family protein n=1 Tax=Cloacibacterium sp. TaxID=1913682 RepID=UPI0035B397C4
MNKNFSVLLFLMMISFLSAQNQRFMYEYKFVSDSTNKADIKTELMNLDTTPKGSKFYSYTSYKSDSLMRVDLEKQLKTTGSINIKTDQRKGFVRYTVAKNYQNGNVDFRNRIGMDAFKVTEDRKIAWKILPNKQKIGNWETQKATTEFGGRKWTAWFCNDIPIQDGPYKFSGLPGIIVKLEDQTQSHVFNLVGIKNLGTLEPEIYAFEITKEIPLKGSEYKKLLLENRSDPAKGLRQISMDNGVVLNMNNSAETNKFMKEREERLKEQVKKDNNIIEIDLLK